MKQGSTAAFRNAVDYISGYLPAMALHTALSDRGLELSQVPRHINSETIFTLLGERGVQIFTLTKEALRTCMKRKEWGEESMPETDKAVIFSTFHSELRSDNPFRNAVEELLAEFVIE